MTKRQPEQISRNSTHLAGEYFVAAELYRRGYEVGITVGNAKAQVSKSRIKRLRGTRKPQYRLHVGGRARVLRCARR